MILSMHGANYQLGRSQGNSRTRDRKQQGSESSLDLGGMADLLHFLEFQAGGQRHFHLKKTPSDLPQKSTQKLTQNSTQKVMYGKNKGQTDKPKFKCTEEQKKRRLHKRGEEGNEQEEKTFRRGGQKYRTGTCPVYLGGTGRKKYFISNNFFLLQETSRQVQQEEQNLSMALDASKTDRPEQQR